MQRQNYSFLQVIRIGFLAGLAYALLFGLPLYICCAFWFSLVFPQQNYAIGLSLLLAFATVLQIGIALVFWGYWRLGVMMAKKTGTLLSGLTTSGWMAIIVILLLGLIYQVSTVLANTLVEHSDKTIRVNAFVLESIYFFAPFLIFIGSMIFSPLGGWTIVKKIEEEEASRHRRAV